MAIAVPQTEPALDAYEALAPFYDRLTAAYRHDVWLARLDELVRALGLRGHRLLDAACGTGKSFAPMLGRGWDVWACDLSPAMARIAEERHPAGAARVSVADVRELPPLGPFDLVTCLDDALNYLLEDGDLERAFERIAAVLRPGGMLAFDLNTLLTYRTTFATDFVVESADTLFLWRGEGDAEAEEGTLAVAAIEVLDQQPGGLWRRTVTKHVQRHHPIDLVAESAARAGLELVALRGQLTGANLTEEADDLGHPKLLYVCRKPD